MFGREYIGIWRVQSLIFMIDKSEKIAKSGVIDGKVNDKVNTKVNAKVNAKVNDTTPIYNRV